MMSLYTNQHKKFVTELLRTLSFNDLQGLVKTATAGKIYAQDIEGIDD